MIQCTTTTTSSQPTDIMASNGQSSRETRGGNADDCGNGEKQAVWENKREWVPVIVQ
jgi:hypothetical protein